MADKPRYYWTLREGVTPLAFSLSDICMVVIAAVLVLAFLFGWNVA